MNNLKRLYSLNLNQWNSHDNISGNISTDESVPCFDFTEESVNASRELNF